MGPIARFALAPLGALILLQAGEASAAEPTRMQRERILNLGLFSGYVVACGFASEEQASEMFETLKAGVGDLSKRDVRQVDQARKAGRATKCPDGPLKRAVERGWSNYKNARFAPDPPQVMPKVEEPKDAKPAEAPAPAPAEPPKPDEAPAPAPDAPKDQPAPERGP